MSRIKRKTGDLLMFCDMLERAGVAFKTGKTPHQQGVFLTFPSAGVKITFGFADVADTAKKYGRPLGSLIYVLPYDRRKKVKKVKKEKKP